MEKGDLQVLKQLGASLEEAQEKLEKAYRENNVEDFNSIKKIILNINNQINKILQ